MANKFRPEIMKQIQRARERQERARLNSIVQMQKKAQEEIVENTAQAEQELLKRRIINSERARFLYGE